MGFSARRRTQTAIYRRATSEGQLIVGNRQELKAAVQEALDQGERQFLIDFSRTGYIDSSGPRRAGVDLQEGPGTGRRAPPVRAQRGPALAVRADQARHPVRHRRHRRTGPGGASDRATAPRPPRSASACAAAESRAPPGPTVQVSLRVPSDVGCIEEVVDLILRHCCSGQLVLAAGCGSTSGSRSPRRWPTPSWRATGRIAPSRSTSRPSCSRTTDPRSSHRPGPRLRSRDDR